MFIWIRGNRAAALSFRLRQVFTQGQNNTAVLRADQKISLSIV